MPDLAALDRLRQVRGFVLDMDGTLVLGDRNNRGLLPLPGAVELVDTLLDRGLAYCVYTNGTVKTRSSAPTRCGRPASPCRSREC